MISWNDFSAREPDMAKQGGELLYHFGVGLGFLATVRPDGGPRLHPMCPLIADAGLFAFIVRSPKQRDLHRDGRFSLHSFPLEENEDAFYISGSATFVADRVLIDELARQFVGERADLQLPPPGEQEHLFEFKLNAALLTRTKGHGDPEPVHWIWRE